MSEANDKVEISGFIEGFTGSLAGVSTKYPVLAPTLASLRITGFKVGTKVKDGNEQKTLYVELETLSDHAEFEKEENIIKAGHKMTDTVLLTPTGEWTQESTEKSLARIMDAGLGNHDGAFNAGDLVGKTVQARIGVRPPKGQYEAKNQIERYIPLS